ncbi:hypothetical protein EBB07_26710 [Paenibacillaceae bacterium]|nr:hypothetical protein EBB07_26710 [Paenibacillaceae bacterium]
MFTKQRKLLFVLLAVLLVAVIAACGKKEETSANGEKSAVNETKVEEKGNDLEAALLKTMDIASYNFSAGLSLDEINIPDSLSGDPAAQAQAQAIMSMIQNSTLNVTGSYQADPMRLEMDVNVEVKGDMSLSLNIPIIMTEDVMWFKIPNTPFFPVGPYADKFVEINMKELAETQGAQMPELDIDLQRKLGQDMMAIVIKHFNDKDNFKEISASETSLPADLNPEKVVKFSITNDNLEDTVKTVIENIAPEVIELMLQNEEYRNTLQLTVQDLEEAKTELAAFDRAELQSGLDQMKEELTINDISLIGAIKDGYLAHQQIKVNADVKSDGETVKIGFTIWGQYDNINDKVNFKHEIPTDAVSLEELFGNMQGM